ncbi:unnamed protein product [Haemonchus placei]|uniref:Uncharacterized protein n=1 Tax=Haemonchus placei TaxID=6290 RepID=A0A0N4WY00_HAEPC|nr:unnamed protein product [Haemonchus placei]
MGRIPNAPADSPHTYSVNLKLNRRLKQSAEYTEVTSQRFAIKMWTILLHSWVIFTKLEETFLAFGSDFIGKEELRCRGSGKVVRTVPTEHGGKAKRRPTIMGEQKNVFTI